MKTLRLRDTIDHLTEAAVKESSTSFVEPGALLMVVRSGILAHTIPVAINEVRVTLNQDMKALRFQKLEAARYFAYLIQGHTAALRTRWLKEGATVESIEHALLANELVPNIDTRERNTIVEFLDYETAKMDALIEKQQQLIDLLKEKRQAVISHAVTKGLNPDAPMRDSGVEWLGKVPAHWEVVSIGRKITLSRGIDITKDEQRDGPIPVVSSGGISSYHDRATCAGPGVVVGRKGAAGKVHYIETAFWAHDTTLFVAEYNGNVPRYVYYKLLSMNLSRFDTGSANPTLNRNEVHPEKVSWPPNAEQLAIAQYLDVLCEMTEQTERRALEMTDLLQERRAALISAAVTGKIDVRGWQPPVSATSNP